MFGPATKKAFRTSYQLSGNASALYAFLERERGIDHLVFTAVFWVTCCEPATSCDISYDVSNLFVFAGEQRRKWTNRCSFWSSSLPPRCVLRHHDRSHKNVGPGTSYLWEVRGKKAPCFLFLSLLLSLYFLHTISGMNSHCARNK